MMDRKEKNAFYFGVLAALGVVYVNDAETVAEEIVYTIGPSALLRIAQQNEDCFLLNLKHTIRFLKERNRIKHAV